MTGEDRQTTMKTTQDRLLNVGYIPELNRATGVLGRVDGVGVVRLAKLTRTTDDEPETMTVTALTTGQVMGFDGVGDGREEWVGYPYSEAIADLTARGWTMESEDSA